MAKAKTTRAKPTTQSPSPPARKLGRKPPPENETRSERFQRIGAKRMQAVLHQIQLLGNLCGPHYECDGDDIGLMRDTIHRELEAALARFSPKKRAAATSAFSFVREPTQH